MTRKQVTERILAEKLVVIIRSDDQKKVPLIVEALVSAGVGVLEITSNTPGFEDEIKAARRNYPEVLIGAGTMINREKAEKALKAGAQFLVTPNANEGIAVYAHENNLPVLMGALTPTEIVDAASFGADIVKLFPADLFGVDYLKAVRAPLDNIPMFAVGGIGNENAREWMEAGAAGLGVGGKLTKLNGLDARGIIDSAQELRAILAAY